MKKYINPELEVELFEGQDLFALNTPCDDTSCFGEGELTCPNGDDVGFDPGVGCGDDICGGDCLMVLGM